MGQVFDLRDLILDKIKDLKGGQFEQLGGDSSEEIERKIKNAAMT
jgi:hypothetical protein